MAAIVGLEALNRPCQVELYSDSKYVVDAFNPVSYTHLVKDFMFVVTDAQGASYAFTFDGEKPAGLDDAKIGDKVTVTYTGEISEVDPFEGEVLSVEVSK